MPLAISDIRQQWEESLSQATFLWAVTQMNHEVVSTLQLDSQSCQTTLNGASGNIEMMSDLLVCQPSDDFQIK